MTRQSDQWYFSRDALAHTPSILHGWTVDKERQDRLRGAAFISGVGTSSKLMLPQIVIATATVFFHRFYMRHSFREYHPYDLGGTCLFLAAKVEEHSRKLRDVINACYQKAQKSQTVLEESNPEYEKWKRTITFHEEVLLETICFDLDVQHPYKHLLQFTKEIKGSKTLAQTAWAFINDSLRTPLCLIYRPHIIAAAALFLALKFHPEDIEGQAQISDQYEFEGGPLMFTIGPKSSSPVSVSYSTAIEIANEILDQYVSSSKGALDRKPGSDYQPNTPSHPSPLPGTPSWQPQKDEKGESPSMRSESTMKPSPGLIGPGS